jgi:PAS domain S-box-containing protein
MTPEETRSNPADDHSTDSTGSPESHSAQALRQRAEALAVERARSIPEDPEALSPEVARRTLHELRVHQVELEMQNEELRRAQEELEASRARYFDLYDLAPVAYVTLSEKGLILEANLTAAKLLGVARGALVKQPLSSFVLSEDQDTYYLHRKVLWATGAPQSWEMRVLKEAAAPFWVRVEATTAQDADGASICRAVVSDITKSKFEAEEKAKIEAQYRQLQKAEGLGRMAGAIAHHFNNRLAVVMGNLELSIGDLPRGAGPADKLTDALQAAREVAEVGKLLLTYLGQTQARPEPLDLSEVCRRSLPMLQAAMPKDIVLETDLSAPSPAISADSNQIQQVLANLVTNAWEAARDGGRFVHLAVKTVPSEDIPALHRFPIDWRPQDKTFVRLEVRDAGSGIADKDIEKLFDPFYSSKFAGRGLGLSAVLGIVRAHRGAVTVESEPGRGSTFRVFLPVSAEEVLAQPDQAAKSPEIAVGGTVLLVDDDQRLRKLGETMLKHLGFDVLLAADGVEAMEVFEQHKDEIRCVLCDLTMPGMNGWETLTALRKLAPGLPVILASGYDKAQVMAGRHPELPQVFLSKPFNLQVLRDAIGLALACGK